MIVINIVTPTIIIISTFVLQSKLVLVLPICISLSSSKVYNSCLLVSGSIMAATSHGMIAIDITHSLLYVIYPVNREPFCQYLTK